ncbi:hypothetical protein FB45DRAFT_468877 [Roridomyces roridus]|uniref:Uncharacterized protein n=1 Tax=Roridomyces roridus TaxID=1738132 RepID=A0AAD7FR10_9AGAR|nr:hypothetical protein FB45DRAFT_468877 [Roridomyces roridus]
MQNPPLPSIPTKMPHYLVLLALVYVVHAQTLLLPSLPQPESLNVEASATVSMISALGVDADSGMTTYVEVVAETLAVEISGTSTITLLSEPLPYYTVTFLEDDSEYVQGTPGTLLFESCAFGTAQGTCVIQAPSGTASLTQTFTGPVQPWITVNAAAGASQSRSDSESSASQTGTSTSASASVIMPPTSTAPTSSPPAPSGNAAVGSSFRTLKTLVPSLLLPYVLYIV